MTTTTAPVSRPTTPPTLGATVYRFQGELGPLNPVGLFDDGIRFHNTFEGRIVDGPFTGGRIGEIHAPELIESGSHRVALDVRGYVTPPAGAPVPPLAALLEPGFEFPDVPFRVTGSALAATTSPEYAYLNGTTIVVEGHVNMATGHLDVTARTVEPPATSCPRLDARQDHGPLTGL